MTECKFADLIDEYLLNKLSEEKRSQFEEHYFNCHSCFQKMAEKDEMITAIKWRGPQIFADLMETEQPAKAPVWDRVFGFMTPKHWALAAASAALVLVVAFSVIPSLKTQSPQFYLDDHQTRGRSITLISDAIPSRFQWQAVTDAWEYQIQINNHDPLWEETTSDNFIILPDEVKVKMLPGVAYSYQVKAFSKEGTLIAESSKIQFTIPRR
jgi:hypothetical protein